VLPNASGAAQKNNKKETAGLPRRNREETGGGPKIRQGKKGT